MKKNQISRSEFMKLLGVGGASFLMAESFLLGGCTSKESYALKLSLAQWSLHKHFFEKKLDHLDFAKVAKSFGFEGLEYVRAFFPDRAKDTKYLSEMNQRANEYGLKNLLIMVDILEDKKGDMCTKDPQKNKEAVERHYEWVDAAKYLGCHSIRVNLFGEGTPEEQQDQAAESLKRLSEYAQKENINILVENHGGLSSDIDWLIGVFKKVNMKNCGALPDFGNFCIEREGGARWRAKCLREGDKYEGVKRMMPYAIGGISAKSYDFNENQEHDSIDYLKMLQIIKKSGYKGFIGVEYEGKKLDEMEGIRLTKELLEKTFKKLS